MSGIKRVLCLVSCMNTGGAETFLMKLYRKIDREKFQMDFGVYTSEKGFYDDEIQSLGGKIFHLTPKTENFSAYKKSLYDLVKKERYEYVFRITSNAAGFYDLKIAKEAGARVCVARSSNSSDGGGLKVNIINYISRFLYQKYVDIKIAPSILAAEYTFGKKAVNRGEVHYLKNGLDLDIYRYSQESRNNIRKEFSIEDKFVIGHIGRFSKQKNHDFLIDVFTKIKKQRNNTVLLLVGMGELEAYIKAKVRDLDLENSVIFAGLRSDIPALLSAMDVFVFPSFYEGLPNVVIEAQATGLPCLISDRITREAQIIPSVQYLPLNNIVVWENAFTALPVNGRREEASNALKKAGYDINKVVEIFTSAVFA